MSKAAKSRSTRPISKAELKAYQKRRAEESRRIAIPQAEGETVTNVLVRHAYTLSRDEEFAVIRSDLIRLLKILAFLFVVIIVATVFLR